MKNAKLLAAIIFLTAPALAQTPAPAPATSPNAAPVKLAPPGRVEPLPTPTPAVAPVAAAKPGGDHQLSGVAAFYNSRLNGRKTASGQRFDNNALTAAHNTLPFGTKIKVTNTKNNRSVVVRVNDRGPTTPGRVFDLTRAAAAKLGYLRDGTAEVTAEIVSEATLKKAKK
jgi:rare lipoprotein A